MAHYRLRNLMAAGMAAVTLFACETEELTNTPLLPEITSCLTDRATVQTFNNEAAVVISQDGALFIRLSNGNLLAPCNLPNAFLGNEQVVFSGNQKEALPDEQSVGQPLDLISIDRQNI